jgi:hypothetical protein
MAALSIFWSGMFGMAMSTRPSSEPEAGGVACRDAPKKPIE